MTRTLRSAAVILLLATLAACSGRLGLGDKSKDEPQKTVDLARPNTPDNRAVQVAWTAARASYCAFGMDRAKLRSDYLAYERAQGGAPPQQMERLERLYDATYRLFYAKARQLPRYCTREKIEEIRPDINRHLRGDYTPSPRKPAIQEADVDVPDSPVREESQMEKTRGIFSQ